MAYNVGKQFEERFSKNWKESFPNSFVYRLHDQLSGYKVVSRNPCDFICFEHGRLHLIECKSHKGASMPFTNLRQYDEMIKYAGIENVFIGVVLWLMEKDVVIYIPLQTITQMMQDGKKSVGMQSIKDGYNILEIPSKKLRTFMQSDYSVLSDFCEKKGLW